MLLLYCITLSVPKSSILFFVSHDHITFHTMTGVMSLTNLVTCITITLYPSSKSKIKKSRIKTKNKRKEKLEKKNKVSKSPVKMFKI